MSTAADDIAAGVAKYAPLAETIAEALLDAYGGGPAAMMTIKLILGAAAKLPDAVSLVEQFQSGTVPTQAELDAYANDETGSYNKLIADLAK